MLLWRIDRNYLNPPLNVDNYTESLLTSIFVQKIVKQIRGWVKVCFCQKNCQTNKRVGENQFSSKIVKTSKKVGEKTVIIIIICSQPNNALML